MAWDLPTTAEVSSGKPVQGPGGFGEKVRSCLSYLFGQAGGSSGGNVPNGSFETLDEETGLPVSWTLSTYPSGTIAVETAAPGIGSNALAFTHPGGASNGGGEAVSDYVGCFYGSYPVSILIWATNNATRNKVIVEFFDKDKVALTGTDEYEVLYDSNGTPESQFEIATTFNTPASARYYKIKLVGGSADTDEAGITFFDGVSVGDGTPDSYSTEIANTDQIYIAEAWSDNRSWEDIGAPIEVFLDRIDGGSGTTIITCTIQNKLQYSGSSGRVRFRVGTDYSNEFFTSGNTSYAAASRNLTFNGLTAAQNPITVQLQAYCSTGRCYGRIISNDTTVQISR